MLEDGFKMIFSPMSNQRSLFLTNDVIVIVASIDDLGPGVQHSLKLVYREQHSATQEIVQQSTLETTKLSRAMTSSSGSARRHLLVRRN